MLFSVDSRLMHFGEPQMLWLLVAPAALLLLWARQLGRRRRDGVRLRRSRMVPVRERFAPAGDLLFWLCLTLAVASTILALARPRVVTSRVRTAGVDLVILQDGSASMHVKDVRGDRWQRSMRFLRTLGESISWTDDRIAMALFAHIATPQVRLTRDPNTFFFFLDHLDQESPFRLEDDTSWDTNIEIGIYWGLRLIEKDEQIHGASPNAKVFVLISDGQAWSGEVEKSIVLARKRDVPLFVIGVGTTAGGLIPEPAPVPGRPPPAKGDGPIRASLDRGALSLMAVAGGGRYLELDRESDREIANTLLDAARRRSGSRGVEEHLEELYWQFLVLAAGLLSVGVCFLRERAELLLQLAGAAIVLATVFSLMRG